MTPDSLKTQKQEIIELNSLWSVYADQNALSRAALAAVPRNRAQALRIGAVLLVGAAEVDAFRYLEALKYDAAENELMPDPPLDAAC